MPKSRSPLPLYRKPGTVVFIDDEHDYLEMMGLIMPTEWHVEFFLRPTSCLEYFDRMSVHSLSDLHVHQRIVDKWRQGCPLVPQLLRYWSDQPERYGLPQVLVVDYAMPAMNGLLLLQNLPDWTGSSVLLSGRADEHIAVDAFNRGLLKKFIPKQTPDIGRYINQTVQHLLNMPSSALDQIWQSTLTPVQQNVLNKEVHINFLTEFVSDRWIESVVIGEPFGVLGLDQTGKLSWLQLELASSLHGLAELVRLQEVPDIVRSHISDISCGNLLTDVELQLSLHSVEKTSVLPSFAIGSPDLLGAIFPLDALPNNFSLPLGYRQWHARQGERTIHE